MLQAREIPIANGMPVLSNPADLKKLILKLRWIGMEDEAVGLYSQLLRIAPNDGGAVLWPMDTD
jgi:hypothetical protein